ncbi:MAG: hypothetical protein ACYC9S_04575 [Leptospirales bacterium]
MAAVTLKRDEILQKAEKMGRMALVDPVPDPTEEGMSVWQGNIRNYFMGICDDLVTEYHAEEMRGEILAALERGFATTIRKQPVMDVPTETAIQLLKDVFRQMH